MGVNDKCTNVFIVAADRLFGTPTLLLKTMELKGKELFTSAIVRIAERR